MIAEVGGMSVAELAGRPWPGLVLPVGCVAAVNRYVGEPGLPDGISADQA